MKKKHEIPFIIIYKCILVFIINNNTYKKFKVHFKLKSIAYIVNSIYNMNYYK